MFDGERTINSTTKYGSFDTFYVFKAFGGLVFLLIFLMFFSSCANSGTGHARYLNDNR